MSSASCVHPEGLPWGPNCAGAGRQCRLHAGAAARDLGSTRQRARLPAPAPRRTRVLDCPAELGKLRLEPRLADHVGAIIGSELWLAPGHGRPDDGALFWLHEEAGMRHISVVDLETTTKRCEQVCVLCVIAVTATWRAPGYGHPYLGTLPSLDMGVTAVTRPCARARGREDLARDARPVRPDARFVEEPDLLHSCTSGSCPAPGTQVRSCAIDIGFARVCGANTHSRLPMRPAQAQTPGAEAHAFLLHARTPAPLARRAYRNTGAKRAAKPGSMGNLRFKEVVPAVMDIPETMSRS